MKIKKNRKIKIFLVASIVLVICWNVLWIANYISYYESTDGFKVEYGDLEKKVDEYFLYVFCPKYPTFTGNYSVSDSSGDINIIIWPGFFTKEEWRLGIQICNEESNHGYRFYIDENMKYDDKFQSGLSEETNYE